MKDEPFLSPSRLWRATCMWAWLQTQEPPLDISWFALIRGYRRPYAARRRY